MKRIVFAAVTALLLSACGVSNKTVLPIKASLPGTVRVSPAFRMMWNDYVPEVNQYQKMAQYEPSVRFVEQYGVQKEGKRYFVSGFVTVVEGEFDVEEAKKRGIGLSKMTGDTYTYRCDLKLLPELVGLKGVKYVESATKVGVRN